MEANFLAKVCMQVKRVARCGRVEEWRENKWKTKRSNPGEYLHTGHFFYFWHFSKMTEIAQIFGAAFFRCKCNASILTKFILGCSLGDFFTNSSSGHPGFYVHKRVNFGSLRAEWENPEGSILSSKRQFFLLSFPTKMLN
jgi:hypothetical protein